MIFIILMLITTGAIAGSAAYFSVIGLASVFSGAFWPVIFMGSSLELGKLVTASYVYRHWKDITIYMKTYMLIAIVILMSITSMGIFGFLSKSFQSNILPYQQQQQQIVLLENDKSEAERLKTERMGREEEINKQIADLPSDYVTSRKRLMDANKQELQQIRTDVASYTEQIRNDTIKIAELKSKVLVETAHVGPIIFIAQVFGADVNQSTKWLIILLILVFDPLAVILTVGTNLAILKYKNEKNTKPVEKTIKVEEKSTTAPTEGKPHDVVDKINPTLNTPESAFSKAHAIFSNPNLSEHEKNVARTLEETIKRYMHLIGK